MKNNHNIGSESENSDISSDSSLENYPDYIEKVFTFKISRNQQPERIDSFLTRSVLNATRNKVQKAIEAGSVLINNREPKPSRKIQPGDEIVCRMLKPPPIVLTPEDIPLDIIFEDEHLLVVNKPTGMVTHPGFGNRHGTLVNAVLYHIGKREEIKFEYDEYDEEYDESVIYSSDDIRPGVVHRLDKDTSGLIVVSKNPVVHAFLAKQFADRTIQREYRAIVWGLMKENSGTITGNIGRSPRDRKLFAVVKNSGKHAITDYEVIESFEFATLLKIHLSTGRTHQIRVHFAHNHHPVFGDPSYGGNKIVYGGNVPSFRKIAENCLKTINRQMLHAAVLGFEHPISHEFLSFSKEPPNDMLEIIDKLTQINGIKG